MRCYLLKRCFISAVLIIPNITFSYCPHCENSGSLMLCPSGQVHCSQCGQDIFPNRLFYSRRKVWTIGGDALVIGQLGTNLHTTNQLMLHTAGLNSFNPTMIISNENLNRLLSYMRHFYHGVFQSPHIVFSAISLAQLLMLNVPALSQFQPAEYQIALWWLVAYWILYMSPHVCSQAQGFLAQAPVSLQLNAAQEQITNLQNQINSISGLPELTSLFNNGSLYTLSAAQARLSGMEEGTPHIFWLFRATFPGGILIVIQRQGSYYVITPYNHYFRVTSMTCLLRMLSQIASVQWVQRGIMTGITGTGFWSGLGSTVGAVTGIPFVTLALLGGTDPKAVMSAYAIWMAMSAAAFHFRYL